MAHTRVRLSAPTESLRQDHRRIGDLLQEFASLPPEELHRREWFFDQIHRQLLIHFTVEEEVLYPALRKTAVEKALEAVDEAEWGHRLLRQLLTELSQMSVQDRGFASKIGMLEVNLDYYMHSEEQALFPEARKMSRELQEGLRTRLHEVRERLLDQDRQG